jgi:hypothetical protein
MPGDLHEDNLECDGHDRLKRVLNQSRFLLWRTRSYRGERREKRHNRQVRPAWRYHGRSEKAPNEAIYERAGVKRGGADFVSRASRTSPSPSASVDLADLNPVRGRVGRATRNTSSEPEAEGEYSPSVPVVFEALADVT